MTGIPAFRALAFFAFLLFQQILIAQWTPLQMPHSGGYKGQMWSDSNRVWASLDGEDIFRSEDSGLHWRKVSNGPFELLMKNGADWYAVTQENQCTWYCLKHSTDEGHSWTTLTGLIHPPEKMIVLNGRLYWYMIYNYFSKLQMYDPATDNLSTLWEYQDEDYEATDIEASANAVFMATRWGLIRARNNGSLIDTLFPGIPTKATAVHGDTVFAFAQPDFFSNPFKLYYSLDEGDQWTQLPLGCSDEIFDLKFAGGIPWLLLQDDARVRKVLNNYSSWKVESKTKAYDVARMPDGTMLLAGGGGVIRRKPGDLNWSTSTSGMNNPYPITVFPDDVLSNSSEFSLDTGQTWTTSLIWYFYKNNGLLDSTSLGSPGEVWHKNGFFYARVNYLGFLRSPDMITWTRLNSDYYNIVNIFEWGDGFASFHDNVKTFKTSTDGINWTESPYQLPDGYVYNEFLKNGDMLYTLFHPATGSNYYLKLSPDLAAHWYDPVEGFPALNNNSAVYPMLADGNSVFVRNIRDQPNGSQQFDHYISHDFGYHWKKMGPVPATLGYYANMPTAIRDNSVFLTDGQQLVVSANDGETWSYVDRDSIPGYITSIAFLGDEMLITTDSGGWRRPLAGIELRKYEGTVYFDQNNNQVQDAGETGIPGVVVRVNNRDIYTTTDSTGHYAIYAEIIGDTIAPVMWRDFWTCTPGFAAAQPDQTVNNFAVYIDSTLRDVGIVAVAVTPFREFFENDLELLITNYGAAPTGPFQVGIHHYHDNYPTVFQYSDPAPVFNLGDSLVWDIANIPLFSSVRVKVHFYNPYDFLLEGFSVNLTAEAFLPGDYVPANNVYRLISPIVFSHDPNDKTVYPDRILPEAAGHTDLQYLVRFQNTGTYKADWVIVKDTLPELLDPATLQVTGASHAYTWKLLDSRILEVRFDNINLPDSTSNEPESHGYVSFSIRADSTVQLGDTIKNRVGIYFDYNPPVMTEYAQLLVKETSATQTAGYQSMDIRLTPNPVSGQAAVQLYWPEACGPEAQLLVFDALGKAVRVGTPIFNGGTLSLDGLTPGAYFVEITAGKYRGRKVLVVQ